MSHSMIFLGVHGEVLALDRTTGQELWNTKLRGSDFVNVFVDGDRIFASTKGEVFCIDAATGKLLWRNELPGRGLGLITIASQNGSTSLLPLQREREEDEAAASAAVIATT